MLHIYYYVYFTILYIFVLGKGYFAEAVTEAISQNKKTETIKNNDSRLSVDIFDLIASALIKPVGNVAI